MPVRKPEETGNDAIDVPGKRTLVHPDADQLEGSAAESRRARASAQD
jgi:hypothetical protein